MKTFKLPGYLNMAVRAEVYATGRQAHLRGDLDLTSSDSRWPGSGPGNTEVAMNSSLFGLSAAVCLLFWIQVAKV